MTKITIDWKARRDKLYKEQKFKVNQVDTAVDTLFEGTIHLDLECASYPRPEADDLREMKKAGMQAVFQATKVMFWIEKYYNLRRTNLELREAHLKLRQEFDAYVEQDNCSRGGVEPDYNIEDDERNLDDGVNDVGGALDRAWP